MVCIYKRAVHKFHCITSLNRHTLFSARLPAIDSDVFEFYIVSLDGKQWHFEAASCDERDEWVADIEQEIFKSLQGNESGKTKQQTSSEMASMQSIRSRVPGNGFCVDCDAQSMCNSTHLACPYTVSGSFINSILRIYRRS